MEGTQLIEVWEPGKHLRMIDERERPGALKTRLVVDYYLETKDGKTVLRLVHAGFGSDSAWDGEYNGTKSGWPVFFRTLKFGLERHPGKPVRNLSFFHTQPNAQVDEVFARLMQPGLEGEEYSSAPGLYNGVVRAWGDALVTVMVSANGADVNIYLAAVLYGLSGTRIAEIEQECQRRLQAG